jgi:hypothetical protein
MVLQERASPGGGRGWGLREASDMFLRNPDTASTWLRQADEYMQAYVQNPGSFILPREHAFLQPVIETYAYNLEGFTQYLIGVRDSFEKGSLAWDRVQTIYRRVMGRHTQKIRRERADRAVAKAEALYGLTDFHSRLAWVARLEHEWAKRRLDFLELYRSKTENNRLCSDERAERLAEFWDIIDTEISNGEVPPWS